MDRYTDQFFRDGEWCEEAYQRHLAEEAKLAWEKNNAPWQSAMRGWLKGGSPFPTVQLRFDGRGCALAIYCRGRAFEVGHGFSPCQACPYGLHNLELFKDLSRALGELRTTEQCQQRSDFK